MPPIGSLAHSKDRGPREHASYCLERMGRSAGSDLMTVVDTFGHDDHAPAALDEMTLADLRDSRSA